MSAADNGLSDAEPARKRGGRGRQPRKIVVDAASTSSRGADSSVPGTPVQPTQTVNPNDPLAMDELSILGVTAAENTLPVLHKEGQTAGDANAVNRTMNAVAATSRPKRPKSIKFSPSKQKRRSAASKGQNGKETAAAEPDPAIPNHDYCDTCGGKGHFLCCDGGCLRSFHFVCLEPPVRLDEIADDEAWFCKACRASKDPPPKPPRGFFSELIYKAETENPTIFSLPADIKNWYRNVTAGPHGEYINSNEHRPPSKITGRPVGIEDRDGYRLKDKSGKTILCYRCNEAASVAKQRRIISCDFCDQHWHLDCLDPPMTALPPPTRKWMCPVHSDPNLVKRKVPRSTQTITVPRPGMPNNGDLIILPARKSIRPLDEFEEITVNRVRYQIPEETVILDFWARVHTGSKFKGLSSPERRQIFKQLSGANGHNRDISPNSLGSPLTSLDELSDGDAPGALAMPLPVITGPPLPPGAPSALDFLAQVAENAANSLALEQTTDEPKSASQAAAVSTAQAHPKNGLVIKLHDQRHRQQKSAPASPARPSKGESASAHNSTVTTNGAFGRRDQNAAWSRDGTGRQEDGHDVEDEDEVMGEHADGLDGQGSFSPDAMSGATSEQDASMSYHQTGADTGADEEEEDDEDGDDYRAL